MGSGDEADSASTPHMPPGKTAAQPGERLSPACALAFGGSPPTTCSRCLLCPCFWHGFCCYFTAEVGVGSVSYAALLIMASINMQCTPPFPSGECHDLSKKES
jgi:hypothetical protein